MPDEPTVQERIAALAAAAPGAPAVVGGGQEVSHARMAQDAAAVAAGLRGLGVAPAEVVALLVDGSPELPAALLGILAAGGAVLPLDAAAPPGRLAQQLAAARPRALVARRTLAARLPPRRPPVLWADGAAASDGGADAAAAALPGTHADAAPTAGAPPVATFATGAPALAASGIGAPAVAAFAAGAAAASAGAAAPSELDLSLFYFGNYASGRAADHYRLVIEGARFADRHGFRAVWTPERHFHEFGGLFPNPAVLAAAIAATTERVQIRAGSVVLPLHDPLRVAEEWSLVDNLSGGRAGVSFASGWHANDFVLRPGAYAGRHEIMRQGIDTVRRLWRGEALRLPGGAGNEVEVRIFPRPVQAELPVWVTAAGSLETFRLAGELGAGVLTHLLGQDAGEIAAKIAAYRDAWRNAGHGPGAGRVTVMLHTYVAADEAAVHTAVREPLSGYLKTSFGLLRSLARSVGLDSDPRQLAAAELDLLVARAYDRYVESGAGLIGTPETCAATLGRLRALGVDEVGCLIDFGVPTEQVLASLPRLDELRRGIL